MFATVIVAVPCQGASQAVMTKASTAISLNRVYVDHVVCITYKTNTATVGKHMTSSKYTGL